MINVLYVTFASKNFDGATYSLMDLIKSVRGYVHPIVMVGTEGCVYDYFTANGVECIVCDFKEDLVGKSVKLYQHIKYWPKIYSKPFNILSEKPQVCRNCCANLER